MNPKPKFSIILPTYNRAYILWKSILSVVNQRYPYWELIIVDDGSNDDTKKLIAEFNDERIKYFFQPNQGPCIARNNGLTHVLGKWICYLDSDNEYRDDYLYYLNQHIHDNYLIKFGFCNQNVRWELFNTDGILLKYTEESSSFGDNINIFDVINRTKRFDTNGLFHINEPGISWRKEIKYMHDWELLLQLVNKYPNGFLHIPLSLVKYFSRYGKDGMCANANYQDWQNDYIQILKIHKHSKYRPSQKWFNDKIKKYNNLIVNSTGKDIESRTKVIFKL